MKTHLRDLSEEQVVYLLSKDVRFLKLKEMIFYHYSNKVEFAYQLSVILNFSFLNMMYSEGFSLTSKEKDLLVEGMIGCDIGKAGEFILEVPNLVFAMHILETPKNQETLVKLIEELSMVFL